MAKAEYAVGCESTCLQRPSACTSADLSTLLRCPSDYTEQGIGTQADLETAKRWYMRAAAQRNKRYVGSQAAL